MSRLMSAYGPKRTFHDCALMSAFRGKADVTQTSRNVC